MLDEPVTEPVRRLIAKYESRIERLEKANGRLCEQINAMPEIVRCRDCRHYVRDPEPIDPGWPMMCEDTGRDMVEPDGFCAWGERSHE